MALDAKVVLLSKSGRREVKIRDFMLGVNKVDIKKGELLTEIIIPIKHGKCAFYKVGKRNALAISVVNQAVYLEETAGKIGKINIAIGSCAPKCVRAENTEKLITGMYFKDISKKEIKQAMDKDISPISDIRADADYRKVVAVNVLLENIRNLEA
jgi:xanthine dehydrogenase iron-sulfur cluster and FAD-binding subunit A